MNEYILWKEKKKNKYIDIPNLMLRRGRGAGFEIQKTSVRCTTTKFLI